MTDNLLQPDQDQIDIDENKNYLEELVGENKKFKSPEELAKGKWHSDRMIELQNKRLDDLRNDYLRVREENTAKAKLEELIDQIKQQQMSSSNTPPANEDGQRQPQYDLDQLKSLMTDQIREEATRSQQTNNYNKVQAKLVERYGRNYSNPLSDQLRNLGMSDVQITDLAKSAPEAAIRLLGLDAQPQRDNFQTPPQSQQRSDNFAPQGAKKRTWSYYQELKKANPDIYNDRKIANQMTQDAIALGDEFNDGDFYVKGLHEKY